MTAQSPNWATVVVTLTISNVLSSSSGFFAENEWEFVVPGAGGPNDLYGYDLGVVLDSGSLEKLANGYAEAWQNAFVAAGAATTTVTVASIKVVSGNQVQVYP